MGFGEIGMGDRDESWGIGMGFGGCNWSALFVCFCTIITVYTEKQPGNGVWERG